MGRFPSNQLQPRPANKFATTNMVNELIGAMNADQPQFITGQQRHGPLIVRDRRLVSLASSTYTDSRYRLLVVAILAANATGGVGGNPPNVNDPIELAADRRKDIYPSGGSNNVDPTAKNADVGSFITGHNLAEMIYYADSGSDLISGTHLLVDKVGSSPAQLFEAWCIYDDEANPQPHWFFCLPPPEVIYVGLTVHGGTAGAIPPNWTYDLIYRGVTIATNQTPIAPARLSISVEAANSGIAVIEPVGRASYILYYANEAPDTEACTS